MPTVAKQPGENEIKAGEAIGMCTMPDSRLFGRFCVFQGNSFLCFKEGLCPAYCIFLTPEKRYGLMFAFLLFFFKIKY